MFVWHQEYDITIHIHTCLDLDGHPVGVNVEGCLNHAERASDHLDLREVTLQSTSSPPCPEAGLHEGASVSPKCWCFPLNHAQDGETTQKHNCCPHFVLEEIYFLFPTLLLRNSLTHSS